MIDRRPGRYPTIKDYASGPCPAFNACQVGGGGTCPEPMLCAIDRAVAELGSETIAITMPGYKVSAVP